MDDAQLLNNAINQSLPELKRWMPWASDPSLETTIDFIIRGIAQWKNVEQSEFPMIIELQSNQQIIGASGFNEKSRPSVPMFEIGYWIDAQYSGHGYITEAVNALTQFAFEKHNAVRVQICAQADNTKSTRVAERCGFSLEAVLKKFRLDITTNKPCDEVIYTCFSESQLSYKTPVHFE